MFSKFVKKSMDKSPEEALDDGRKAINKGMDLTLEQGLRLECDLYMILQTTQDRVEGIRAFRDKKQPLFRGE